MIAPVSRLTAGADQPATRAEMPAIPPLTAAAEPPARAPSPSIKLTLSPQATNSLGIGSDGNYYDPADANQDGRVGELEQQAYDFDNPPSLIERRLIDAELRAYTAVAEQDPAG